MYSVGIESIEKLIYADIVLLSCACFSGSGVGEVGGCEWSVECRVHLWTASAAATLPHAVLAWRGGTGASGQRQRVPC